MIKDSLKTISFGVLAVAMTMLLIGYVSNQVSLKKTEFTAGKLQFQYYNTWVLIPNTQEDSVALMFKRDPEVRINILRSSGATNTTFAVDFIQNIHNSQVFPDYKPMQITQSGIGKFEKATRIDFSFVDKHANPTQLPTVFRGSDWIITQGDKQVVLSLIAPAEKYPQFLADFKLVSNTITF